MKTTKLKIIAIDQDPRFLEAYGGYFETYFNYALAGCYKTVAEALAANEELQPDMILSEVKLTGISGIEGIAKFRELDPEVRIIMVSYENDFEIIKEAFKQGASGYLTKPVNRKRLLIALNAIRQEGAALSSDIAKKIISMFQKKSYEFFSERENEIIEHLGRGATYKEIADRLFVTTSTISFHLQNIYLKLDVNSKSEALEKLRELDYAG